MLKVYSLCDGDIPRKLPFFLSFMHPAHAFWVWDKTLPQPTNQPTNGRTTTTTNHDDHDGRRLMDNYPYASDGWGKTGYLIQDTFGSYWNRMRIG